MIIYNTIYILIKSRWTFLMNYSSSFERLISEKILLSHAIEIEKDYLLNDWKWVKTHKHEDKINGKVNERQNYEGH